MKIELHLLQNFPPANLNRDDTGSPKDCEFGGVRRARISSQCLKRSIRTSKTFAKNLEGQIAIRTKKSAEPLAKNLIETYSHDAETAQAVAEQIVGAMLGWDGGKGQTKVLFYVGRDEIEELANLINTQWDALSAAVHASQALGEDAKKKDRESADKNLKASAKNVVDAFKKNRDQIKSVDIALFGRMLAEVPGMNVDAACQVAHAISTNKVDMDFDYFTAVDDLNPKEETGAGMIGTTGFNASCFYRYALIDAEQLATNLGDDKALAAEGIRAFLAASVAAIPTGKQNSFAAQTPPSLVMAVVKPNGSMPWSLANAFVKPIRPTAGAGLIERSVAALDTHWNALATMYGTDDMQVFTVVAADVGGLSVLADTQVASVGAVLDGMTDALADWAGGNA